MLSEENKVAIVTGAAQGIGAATVSRLLQCGYTVVAGDIKDQPSVATDSDGLVVQVSLDVSNPDSWRKCVEMVGSELGRLDVLVNAAGTQGDSRDASFVRSTIAHWRHVMAVNVESVLLGSQCAIPLMRRQDGGSIVNVSSLGAYYPTTYNPAYGASKAALMHLTKTVAEIGARSEPRIRCNSVHPGLTETAMQVALEELLAEYSDEVAQRSSSSNFASSQRIPLGRPASPDEVASVILFLASSESSYVTGSEYSVDGGSRLVR